MNIAIILSGGSGQRFGSATPKQYLPLAGKLVIEHSLAAVSAAKSIDFCLVVTAPEYVENPPFALGENMRCIPGGTTRNGSVWAGLQYIAEHFPDCEGVFIHEAARPFLKTETVERYIALLDEYDGVIGTKKIVDSLGSVRSRFEDREDYFLIQAPEAYRFSALYPVFSPDSKTTAPIQQLPPESHVCGDYAISGNLKITQKEDLELAEWLMRMERERNV